MSRVHLRVFLEAIVIRFGIGIFFASFGYVGSGGDATLYLTASRAYLEAGFIVSDAIMIVEQAALSREESDMLVSLLENLEDPSPDTTSALIRIQANLLAIYDSVFSLKLFNIIASSLAVSYLTMKRNLKILDSRLFIYNPVSIYYASCNLKESLTESLVIFVIALSASRVDFLKRLVSYFFLFSMRSSYILAIVVMEGRHFIERMSLSLSLGGMLLVLPFLTDFQWSVMDISTAGPVYSVVYINDFTRGVLGPLVGLLHPFPLVVNLNDWWVEVLYNYLYCIYYWILVLSLLKLTCKYKLQVSSYVKVFFVLKILVAFYVIGGMVVGRLSAPFLPFLIFGFIEMRRVSENRFQRKFFK